MKRAIRVLLLGAVVAGCLASAGPAFATKTVCPSGCLTSSIQAAINAASPGATITIGGGSYVGDLTVNKEVKLVGSGLTTVLYPSTSTPNCGGGTLCAGATNMILVQANNVSISNMRLEGANPSLAGSGIEVGGKKVNARNGIIEDFNAGTGIWTGLTVSKVKVSDIYRRGIYASAEDVKFNFNHDTVENVQAEGASIAMFAYKGSGLFESNKVVNANDAISSNWSKGTTFVKNTITKSGSGVHTDNNGGEAGVADLIEGNSVRECKPDGYGIFVFVPYVSATVKSNKVSSCAVGLAAFSGVNGEGPTFTGNTLNGTAAASTGSTYGAYITTDEVGFGFGNVTATLSANTISHFNTGLYVTQTTPTEGDEAGGQATVTASPNNSFLANGAGAVGEPGTKVNATKDYWGCSVGPNQGKTCQTATGTVEYTPFLTEKP